MRDNKTLATFRLDAQLWEAFKAEAAKNGTNASAALIAYCRDYASGASRQVSSSHIDETFPSIDIDNLDERIDKRIQDAMAAAQAELVSQTSQLLSNFQGTIQNQQQQTERQIERVEAELMGGTVA